MNRSVQGRPITEGPASATAYVGRKYKRPTGSTLPGAGGDGAMEPWHAVRVLAGKAERKPVCRQGSGTLQAPYAEWDDPAIAASRCSDCMEQVADEMAHPPGAAPDDWMYYVEGATLADLRLETDSDGSPCWALWYRLDPRGLPEGDVPTPVRRDIVPPAPIGRRDGAKLVEAVDEALRTRFSVTTEEDDSPDVVAAWRLGPL